LLSAPEAEDEVNDYSQYDTQDEKGNDGKIEREAVFLYDYITG